MNEKAKCKNCTDEMIEEMANEIEKSFDVYRGFCLRKRTECSAINNCLYCNIATHLIEQGYTKNKIPEGSVVLDRQEYQKYCAYKIIEPQIKGCLDRERELEKQVKGLKEENHTLRLENNDLEAQVEQARKETAKEILKLVKEKSWCYQADENGKAWTYSITVTQLKELAKQFG